jgi:hypothetical protein
MSADDPGLGIEAESDGDDARRFDDARLADLGSLVQAVDAVRVPSGLVAVAEVPVVLAGAHNRRVARIGVRGAFLAKSGEHLRCGGVGAVALTRDLTA